MMQEKSGRIVRELEAAHAAQDQELKRATADLDVAKRDLEKMRKEREHVLEDLRRLESDNSKIKREQPELKIEELEKKLREADYQRKEVLGRLTATKASLKVRLEEALEREADQAKLSNDQSKRLT